MGNTQYKTMIDAPREKVWEALWGEVTYPLWTAPFAEGSRAETDWEKGSKILFLDANNSGMVSVVADNKPNEFMSIKHIGIVKEGVEDMNSPEKEQWEGSYENYTLKAAGGKTELTVDLGGAVIPQQYLDFFAEAWPKAFIKLKELSEKK